MVDTDNDIKFDDWVKSNPDLSTVALLEVAWNDHQKSNPDGFTFADLSPDNKVKFGEILSSHMKSAKEGALPEEKSLATKILGALEETAAVWTAPESDLERQAEEKKKQMFVGQMALFVVQSGIDERKWGTTPIGTARRNPGAPHTRRSLGEGIQSDYNKAFGIKTPVTFGIVGHSHHNDQQTDIHHINVLVDGDFALPANPKTLPDFIAAIIHESTLARLDDIANNPVKNKELAPWEERLAKYHAMQVKAGVTTGDDRIAAFAADDLLNRYVIETQIKRAVSLIPTSGNGELEQALKNLTEFTMMGENGNLVHYKRDGSVLDPTRRGPFQMFIGDSHTNVNDQYVASRIASVKNPHIMAATAPATIDTALVPDDPHSIAAKQKNVSVAGLDFGFIDLSTLSDKDRSDVFDIVIKNNGKIHFNDLGGEHRRLTLSGAEISRLTSRGDIGIFLGEALRGPYSLNFEADFQNSSNGAELFDKLIKEIAARSHLTVVPVHPVKDFTIKDLIDLSQQGVTLSAQQKEMKTVPGLNEGKAQFYPAEMRISGTKVHVTEYGSDATRPVSTDFSIGDTRMPGLLKRFFEPGPQHPVPAPLHISGTKEQIDKITANLVKFHLATGVADPAPVNPAHPNVQNPSQPVGKTPDKTPTTNANHITIPNIDLSRSPFPHLLVHHAPEIHAIRPREEQVAYQARHMAHDYLGNPGKFKQFVSHLENLGHVSGEVIRFGEPNVHGRGDNQEHVRGADLGYMADGKGKFYQVTKWNLNNTPKEVSDKAVTAEQMVYDVLTARKNILGSTVDATQLLTFKQELELKKFLCLEIGDDKHIPEAKVTNVSVFAADSASKTYRDRHIDFSNTSTLAGRSLRGHESDLAAAAQKPTPSYTPAPKLS